MRFDGRIKTKAWADAVYETWQVLENSTIAVYNPAAKVYNATTRKNELGQATVFWEGSARVQTIHVPVRDRVDGFDRVAQRYQFQIRPNVSGVKDTMTVRVTETELTDALLGYEYNITEIFDSDGVFETTFYGMVNSAR